jgi:hypothetical protein
MRVAQSCRRPEESAAELEGRRWRKSSFSATAECVAVADVGGEVALRNSNGPEWATLVFGRGGLAAWVAGCKAGEFDDLTTA